MGLEEPASCFGTHLSLGCPCVFVSSVEQRGYSHIDINSFGLATKLPVTLTCEGKTHYLPVHQKRWPLSQRDWQNQARELARMATTVLSFLAHLHGCSYLHQTFAQQARTWLAAFV